jgi:hypothetical protein
MRTAQVSTASLLVVLLAGCPSEAPPDGGLRDAPLAEDSNTALIDAPGAERPDGGRRDGGVVEGDVGGPDAGADAACIPTGPCEPGGSYCLDEGTAQRCTSVGSCDYTWAVVACDAGETCGLLRDGREDCAPQAEHVCSDDLVPGYGFPCRTEGASYCTPDQHGSYVCQYADADTCLDAVLEPCAFGEACTNAGFGSCACVANCGAAGQTSCGLDLEGVRVCGDSDGDGCLEWEVETTPCPAGQTCLRSTGACSTTCTDECTRAGVSACYRTPVAVGECGFFDSDPCLDLRFSPCPAERPMCDVGTRTCAECLGGIDCAPGIAACVGSTCTSPAGRCYVGAGNAVTVPALTAPGDITFFFGLRLPAGGPLAGALLVHHPDGTVVDVRMDLLRDGYADTVYTSLTGGMQAEVAALSSHTPGGRWELVPIPESLLPFVVETWAVCVD